MYFRVESNQEFDHEKMFATIFKKNVDKSSISPQKQSKH